jgi:hypothetical protein
MLVDSTSPPDNNSRSLPELIHRSNMRFTATVISSAMRLYFDIITTLLKGFAS